MILYYKINAVKNSIYLLYISNLLLHKRSCMLHYDRYLFFTLSHKKGSRNRPPLRKLLAGIKKGLRDHSVMS